MDPKKHNDIVTTVSILYDSLCESLDDVNFCVGSQIMLCCAMFFAYTVNHIFSVYRFIATNTGFLSLYLVENTMWNLSYLILFIILIALGGMIDNSGHETALLCHQAMNIGRNHHVRDKLLRLSQQISHCRPVAKCFLFDFDWALFLSVGF